MTTGLVGTGDPRRCPERYADHSTPPRGPGRAEGAGADVALDQHRFAAKSSSSNARLRDAGRPPPRVGARSTSRSPGTLDRQRSFTAVGVHDHDDDVLQGVEASRQRPGRCARARGGSWTLRRGSRWSGGGVSRARRRRRQAAPPLRNRDGVVTARSPRIALGAAHERVLTDRCRREELLARGAAHRAGHRRDDHVRQAESVEGGDVRVAVPP